MDPQKPKVMIDPRFFPYKRWFAELYAFSTGESFDAFLKKYPADTAIIDLDRPQVWKSFLQSKEWRLIFYGPTSAVFVDRTIADDRFPQGYAPDRFDHLRNARTALNVFDFALVVGDCSTRPKDLPTRSTTTPCRARSPCATAIDIWPHRTTMPPCRAFRQRSPGRCRAGVSR
jgi:hypothetical protein